MELVRLQIHILLESASLFTGSIAASKTYVTAYAFLKSLKLDLEKRKLEEELGFNQSKIKQHI